MKTGKSRTVSFRVSEEDYEQLLALAASDGHQTVNQLAQESLLRRLESSQSPLSPHDTEGLSRSLRELRESLRLLRERLGNHDL